MSCCTFIVMLFLVGFKNQRTLAEEDASTVSGLCPYVDARCGTWPRRAYAIEKPHEKVLEKEKSSEVCIKGCGCEGLGGIN